MKPHKAVFVDRDGTLNRDVPYCSRPEDFELLPGVGEGIQKLNQHGFEVIVVTNQSGIARGYFTPEMLDKIHHKMKADLQAYGAHIDGLYYCPHHPDEGCECRKPSPSMLLKAAREHNLDLSLSYIIGDSEKDIQAAQKAGCRNGLQVDPSLKTDLTRLQFGGFLEAVEWILQAGEAA